MLIYVASVRNRESYDELREIQSQGRGVFTFTIAPNSVSGKFKQRAIPIRAENYEDALNLIHTFTTMYYNKPKRFEKYTNATIVEIAWQSESEYDELGTSDVIDPKSLINPLVTSYKVRDMVDTLTEFVMANAKQVFIPQYRVNELL